MSVNVEADGTTRQLDTRAEPDVVVTVEDVQDAEKLARLVQQLARENAELRRRWAPRRIDFEGIGTDGSGTTKIRLPHGFGGPVRYWAVAADNYGAGGPSLETHEDTDADTLILVAHGVGTCTIRVEKAG